MPFNSNLHDCYSRLTGDGEIETVPHRDKTSAQIRKYVRCYLKLERSGYYRQTNLREKETRHFCFPS